MEVFGVFDQAQFGRLWVFNIGDLKLRVIQPPSSALISAIRSTTVVTVVELLEIPLLSSKAGFVKEALALSVDLSVTQVVAARPSYQSLEIYSYPLVKPYFATPPY